MEKNICPLCGTEAFRHSDLRQMLVFYECPVCGRYELGTYYRETKINENHLASYLFYHKSDLNEYRYHTVLNKERCDLYKKEFEQGNIEHGLPVHMDEEIVESWYPKTFAERVDNILLYLGEHIPHLGQRVQIQYADLLSLLFIDRKEKETNRSSPNYDSMQWRDDDECSNEAEYMLECLKNSLYLESAYPNRNNITIRLTPNGYARIDEIQKHTTNGRNALVAMKFGDDTKPLREAIRKGIKEAGYNAVFIDEVQHDDFITPELLKYIRDSKFVVVDLTHQNNGAYFEEGYAMGLGKPVIQLCHDGIKLHFDIAQKNTIFWQTEDDIPERLCNRIKATID